MIVEHSDYFIIQFLHWTFESGYFLLFTIAKMNIFNLDILFGQLGS